jgi:hypothetical protein
MAFGEYRQNGNDAAPDKEEDSGEERGNQQPEERAVDVAVGSGRWCCPRCTERRPPEDLCRPPQRDQTTAAPVNTGENNSDGRQSNKDRNPDYRRSISGTTGREDEGCQRRGNP